MLKRVQIPAMPTQEHIPKLLLTEAKLGEFMAFVACDTHEYKDIRFV